MYCTNSTQASHGVAILITTTLPYKILKSIKCRLENYILLKISLRDSVFNFGSVYSPTVSQEPNFMENLKKDILSLGNFDFLIGCNLNMVSDANTITLTNMSQIPNVANSYDNSDP